MDFVLIKLAIFDIDYTITKRETLMQFFKYMIKKDKRNIKFLPRALYCGFMYLIKLYDEKKVKEGFLKFLEGMHEEELSHLASEFFESTLKNILYDDAIKMMKQLKSQGYYIYLISASPEFYVKEFYKIKEVDRVIGTKFKFENNTFIRKMDGANCKGKEKVRRLKEVLKEENIEVDFNSSYMFSDSLSDKPLLDLVGKPYLINYKKNHEIKILKWK